MLENLSDEMKQDIQVIDQLLPNKKHGAQYFIIYLQNPYPSARDIQVYKDLCTIWTIFEYLNLFRN